MKISGFAELLSVVDTGSEWVRPRRSSDPACLQAVFPMWTWRDAVRAFTEMGISNRDTSESTKYVMVSWTYSGITIYAADRVYC